MINFFNNYNNVGDILANLTAGERINEYKEKYNLNRIMSDILINPNANFVYCNGCRFEKMTHKRKKYNLFEKKLQLNTLLQKK